MRWLLNLAYMTLGGYPDKVPPAYLIPPAAFASTEDIGRFRDVAPQAGLNVVATAGGVIVDDFAGSGRFDVVTSNFDSCGPLHYFRNNGDGTFTERTSAAGLDGQLGGLNMVQTDYNNDGCKDILVLRGGWEVPQRKSLLRNNCDGTFTDVTAASGLAKPATSTQTAAWADINNDGLLDLFVGNEDRASQLFLNKGGSAFEDISRAAGVDRVAFTKGVSAADYDNDGFVDFYVSNFNGEQLPVSQQSRQHVHRDGASGRRAGPGRGFATWFFDYDNDGWPDLFATSYFTSVDESVRTYLGLAHNAATTEALQEPGRWDLPGRDGGSRPRQGVHAHGREFRRHRQRRLSRYLSRHGKSVVRLAASQRAPSQQGREIVRGCHRILGDRRAAQGTRYRVCRSGQ